LRYHFAEFKASLGEKHEHERDEIHTSFPFKHDIKFVMANGMHSTVNLFFCKAKPSKSNMMHEKAISIKEREMCRKDDNISICWSTKQNVGLPSLQRNKTTSGRWVVGGGGYGEEAFPKVY